MVFNSYTFVLFLACVLLIHYSPLPWTFKKLNLLLASYLFYAAWNPPFVILLWISTIVDWNLAARIHRSKSGSIRRLLLIASLVVNLGMLAFFKYGNFFLDNFVALAGLVGVEYQPPELDIVLPVGISFYTFQTLSYTIDVYRRRLEPWHSFLDYALYVTFFPQLVAGPIVRAAEFLPQCVQPCRATGRQFGWGLYLLLLGLFQKMVVADALLAPTAERIFGVTAPMSSLTAWCGTLAFAGQIFCDFAGYSTCAIGVAMCLGFSLPDNFHFPYAAVGFSDFWQRWHITLSTWLRDYLYIPLGGNRLGIVRTYVNLMAIMLIGGLWHGASWTFVFWGGLHGVYLVLERLARHVFSSTRIPERSPAQLLLGLLTFAMVCFTWVFFRAETFDQAFSMCGSMLGFVSSADPFRISRFRLLTTLVTVGAIVGLHWVLRDSTLEDFADRLPWWVHSVLLMSMLLSLYLLRGEERAFIYFQF